MAYPCPEYTCLKPSQDLRRMLHLLRIILEPQRMVKRRLLNVVNFYVSCEENWIDSSEPTTSKSQQQKELNSEVQNVKADIKASFKETVSALDSFINYLEAPSEETSEKLKQLCDREKSTGNELLTTREIDETFDVLRSFLIDETKECHDSNHESFSSEKHSVLELSPPVNSVSREASEKDLEKDCENYFQHNSNEKQHRRENLLQILTTYNNHHDDSIVGYESGNFENCQERRIKAMENEIHLLRAENREILMELGQITVEKTARENERRKSELFHRVYCSSSSNFVSTSNDKLMTEDEALGHPNNDDNTLQKSPYVNKNRSTSKASGNGFTKPQATNTNADPTSLVSKAISSKQNVQGAESLVKENDHHPGKEEIMTNDKDESNLHDGDQNGSRILTHNNENKNLRTENLPNIASKKKTNGGEGIDQSGNVTGRSDAASTSREGSNEQSLNQQSYESLSFSVQQDYSNEQEKISLSNVPPTSVATTLYNNYKLLLLSLGQMLLSNDVTKLMTWATQNFPIVNPQNATHVLFQLDENEVINASDLSQLRHFFESIVRFDLVYVIDTFLLGDYGILRQITASKKRDVNTPQTSQTGTTTRYQNLFNAASNSQFSLRDSSLRVENSSEPQSSVLQQKQQSFPLNQHAPNDAKFVPRSPNENMSSAYGLQSLKSVATGFTASQQVVVDGHVTNERRTTAGNSSTNANSSATNNLRNIQTIGSNGSRLSTLRRNQEQSDNWLCSHYKRHCYVKFECCDQFWPCHRCHNNQSTCGRKKLKSRDTQMVKCVYCNKVQQFGEHCCDCGAKFASYYCGKCKHLTGTDDHPYHCEKCGICRIHGDRSFHCDICGVCLDVQLRGNHKCREGSAHDECCICLEDAFTGCQILPCSHKVHKECATQMIRSGITRCPICRESFAHKLERRPLPNSRKRGK